MDYEKKYNEALGRAKKFEEKYGGGYAEYIFPELAESEDERILRVISEAVITFFSDYANDFEDEDRDAALAWLEKQKEQKPSISCGHENDAEWSEEDESCWNLIWDILDGPFTASKEGYKKAAAWFLQNCPKGTKSLRPSWKPSEEQMKALQNAVALTACDKELARLYNQLKKL